MARERTRKRKKKKKGRTCLKKVDARCRGVHRESGQVYRIAGNGFDFIAESLILLREADAPRGIQFLLAPKHAARARRQLRLSRCFIPS